MSTRKCLAPLITLTCALLLALLGPVAHAEDEDEDITIRPNVFSLDSLSPEVFDDTGPLKIGATLNNAPAFNSNWRVEVFLDPTPLTSLDEVDHYISGDAFPGWSLSTQEVKLSHVAAGPRPDSVQIDVTVPQDDMPPLSPSAAGPRGITIALTTDSQEWEARSILIYKPSSDTGYPQTKINTVIKVDDTYKNWDSLTSVGNTPGVSLSIPADTVISDCTSAPLFSKPTEVITRPGMNGDISLMAAINNPSLQSLTESARQVSTSELQKHCPAVNIISNVVFASEQGFVLQALPNLEKNIVVAPQQWNLPEPQDTLITPTAKVLVAPANGETISDDDGQQSLTVMDNWKDANLLLNKKIGAPAQELMTRQLLRSDAINVGLERPDDIRSLLATLTLPHDATASDARTYGERVQALMSGNWMEPLSFVELANTTASTVARTTVPQGNTKYLATTAAALRPLGETFQQASGVANASPQGLNLLTPYMPELLRPTATNLTKSERERLVTVAQRDLSDITDAVEIVPIGTVNLLNKAANFPVSVVNRGDVQLSLVVTLQPSDSRLQAKKGKYVTIAPHSQKEVIIPVTAVGSGDVGVEVKIATPAGTEIASSSEASVRVRANWEDTGTLVLAIILSIFFIFGVIRTIKHKKSAAAGGEDE